MNTKQPVRIIRIFENPESLAENFCNELKELVNTSESTLNCAVSGGSTPQVIYKLLAEKYSRQINWNTIKYFWADERCVNADDSESNYGSFKKNLLDKVIIPPENVHRIKGEMNPLFEAERYSEEILSFVPAISGIPAFDVILLGIGEDGHTASIFPGDEQILISQKICEPTVNPTSGQKRITLTIKVLNNARKIFFIVTGSSKSKIVSKILATSKDERIPASLITPVRGGLFFYLDKQAASGIRKVSA